MKYLTILRVYYLAAYYFTLKERPGKNYYSVSVVAAFFLGVIFMSVNGFYLLFGRKDSKIILSFEALLSHGLSYEEWRTTNSVKEKMDKVQTITNVQNHLPEDLYFFLLLILSFSGLIEYRTETPEEKSESIVGKFPSRGESITGHIFDTTESGVEEVTKYDREVTHEEAGMFESMRNTHVNNLRESHYRGKSLSRLVHDGVQIVFKRKKIGPKRSLRTNAFAKAFNLSQTI